MNHRQASRLPFELEKESGIMNCSKSISLAIAAIVLTGTLGCNDQKSKPAANAKTGAKSPATAGEKGAEAAATPDAKTVVLGADELFAGIPGSTELTDAEIKAWI